MLSGLLDMRVLMIAAALACSSAVPLSSSSCVGDSCASAAAGDAMMQKYASLHKHQSRVGKYASGSWMANAFEDCCRLSEGSDDGLQLRNVTCMDVFDGTASECAQAKPSTAKTCVCADASGELGMPCTGSCRSGAVVHMSGASGEKSADYTQYALLGCIPTVGDDTPTPDEARDVGCMNTTRLCRSGLPFFRHRLKGDEGDAAGCANLCFMHGLDIFGVVKSSVISSECRCGASSANDAVWSHEKSARKEFAPPADMSSSTCTPLGVEVYRYSGLYFMEGLPSVMLKDMIEDTEYVEGIAASHMLGEEIEDGFIAGGNPVKAVSSVVNS